MSDVPHSRIADPKTHYGSGKAQTRLFKMQRLTGAFNVAFLIFLVWFVVRLAGADRAEMVETIRNPLVALVLALLVINVPLHMRIGMREIIDDYVHKPSLLHLSLRLNNLFAILICAVGLLSIIKIFFWG